MLTFTILPLFIVIAFGLDAMHDTTRWMTPQRRRGSNYFIDPQLQQMQRHHRPSAAMSRSMTPAASRIGWSPRPIAALTDDSLRDLPVSPLPADPVRSSHTPLLSPKETINQVFIHFYVLLRT